ncbi:hypothetical protein MHU86_19762 [Fragilaria crotonensis]|nr:hypothetical protein MHU86_19762 [Fragilaria crotonensis]
MTDSFVGLPPGNYTLTDNNPLGCSDVSNYDETPDGDANYSNTAPDNKIVITVTPSSFMTYDDNNFVDRLPAGSSTSAPILRDPPSSPPDFCEIDPDPKCT